MIIGCTGNYRKSEYIDINTYVNQCLEKNAIIGGNGRIGYLNSGFRKPQLMKQPNDTGIRTSCRVDFCGHVWCFKKEWLHYMFREKPYTYDTGEDMQLSFSSKVFGNIDSYVAEHKTQDDFSDITNNGLADDEHSSYKRKNIAEITKNKQ